MTQASAKLIGLQYFRGVCERCGAPDTGLELRLVEEGIRYLCEACKPNRLRRDSQPELGIPV